MAEEEYKSPLHKMVSTTPTDLWNDSCSLDEMKYAIDNGATGATTNPIIVGEVMKKDAAIWNARLDQIIQENPTKDQVDITWLLIEEMAVKGAELLYPVFQANNHKKGRISIQTNPMYWNCAEKMIEQAIHFGTLAENIQVKLPVTEAGIKAIEEVVYNGININATVCFCVPQALAVAEAVERALNRREAEGLSNDEFSNVCTIMVGRLDDWLKVVIEKEGIITDPGYLNWAGVAAMKKAYKIYKERNYRTRLLSAAYRHVFHWTELVGADMVLTITSSWQKRFNASGIDPISKIDIPVDPQIVDELYNKFAEFRKSYDEDGLSIEEFEKYGPTRRTLRGFIDGYLKLMAIVFEKMVPNPD
jgi:transaldolase